MVCCVCDFCVHETRNWLTLSRVRQVEGVEGDMDGDSLDTGMRAEV